MVADDDEIIDEVPDLSVEEIKHDGPVNRVRVSLLVVIFLHVFLMHIN